jgi:hypothetical protein
MFRNGVSVGYAATTATTYTFTGLVENTQYTLGVKSKDTLGAVSTLVTIGPSAAVATTNAAPTAAPTAPVIGVVSNLPTVNTSWTAPALPPDFAHYEVQVLRNSDSALLASGTTATTSLSLQNVAWGTVVRFQVRVVDALGASSSWAVSSTATMMADPVPTGLTVVVNKTDMTVSWTAPALLPVDFTTYRLYEYNGPEATPSWNWPQTALTKVWDDHAYSTPRRFSVRAERTGSLQPSTSAITTTYTTIADPVPTSVTFTASGNSVTGTWGAPTAGEPNDSTVYRVRIKNNVATVIGEATVAYNATQSYTWNEQGYSTQYGFDVRLERSNGQHSSYAPGPWATTGAHPDTTPPGLISVLLRPETSYGRMFASFTLAGDTAQYRVDRSVNGAAWETVVAMGAGSGYKTHDVGSFGAGTNIRVVVYQWDAYWNYSGSVSNSYTLATNPTYVYADATNSWRNNQGMNRWNVMGNYRLVQGYYDTSSWNSTGYLFYGTKLGDACAGKTITGMNLWLQRVNAGGLSEDYNGKIRLYIHQEATSPGTAAAAPPSYPQPGIGTAGYLWGQLAWGQAADVAISSEMVGYLKAGTWKGIAIHQPTGKDYVLLYSVGEQYAQGRVTIFHLG